MRPLIALGLLAFVTTALAAGTVAEKARNVSKPVEKNGLEVTAIVPAQLWQDSPFAFTVSMKNASQSDLALMDAGDFWKWRVMAIQVGGPGRWQLSAGRAEAVAKTKETQKVLKPGEALDVTVDLQVTDGKWEWKGEQEQPRRAVPHLPEGDYELTVEIKSNGPEAVRGRTDAWWRGTAVTSPVKLKVVKLPPET